MRRLLGHVAATGGIFGFRVSGLIAKGRQVMPDIPNSRDAADLEFGILVRCTWQTLRGTIQATIDKSEVYTPPQVED